MYLMQTVSTAPRARPSQAPEQTSSMERSSEIPTLQQVRTSGGEDWSDGGRSPLSPSSGFMFPPAGRTREKESTEKKKKWSLGGLFRRRKKEVCSESSSQEEEDEAPKKGFLARRRSRREKRKPRTNKSVGTFDHIVVNPLTQTLKPPIRSDTGSTIEEINGCARDANGNNVMRGKDLPQVEDVNRREFHAGGSVDRLSSRSSRESFQRHARHDSSLSRNSSGGSGSLEQGMGTRRGRRAVKARAEALRDRQKAESSSEEEEVSANSPLARFKSDDTLSISLQREGSLNRRSRLARTERYIKRLSRDEESVLKREAAELEFQRQQRLCKSDAEGSFNKSLTRNKTVPGANRWVGPAVYHESSDLEHPKMFIRGSSATPSPGHSPLVRHKNILHYTNSAPTCPPIGYDGITSTFPPGHSMHYATPVTTNSLDRKTPQYNNSRPHGPSPLTPSNRSAESIPTVGIPRARINDYRQNRPNYDYGTAGRNEREYVEFQQPGQRSLSYDSNIHCVLPNYSNSASGPSPISDPIDVIIVQFPVARLPPNIQQSRTGNMGTGFVAVKQGAPPPPPPRDPQRRIICSGPGQQDSTRPMSFACDNNQHRFHPTDFLSSVETGSSSSAPFTIPALRHQPSTDIPVADAPLSSNSQKRSNSDNQLATLRYGHQSHISHPHSFNPIGRPRPSSVTPESMKPITHHQQHSGHGNKFVIRTTPSPDTYTSSSNQSVNSGQLQFQYYADQQPRSRRPIHIQYNALTGTSNDQPYLSDSQVVLMKPPHQHQDKRHPMQHATEFWRQKDQEGSLKHKKAVPTSPRLQIRHINRSDRSRSNSPRPKELPTGLTPGTETGFRASKASKMRAPALSIPSVRPADSLSSLSGNSDVSSPLQISTSSKFSPDIGMVDSFESTNGTDSLRRKEIPNSHRPLSMVLENSETPEQVQNAEKLEKSPSESVVQTDLLQQQSPVTSKAIPPTPPSRRYSRQSSTSSLEAADWMSEDVGTSEDGRKKKRRSSNLEDALTELEAIYNSLKLGDEDLLDRAERRDLPIPHQKLNQIPINDAQPLSSSWSTSRGAESDSGYNYSWGSSSFESLFDGGEPPPRRRAPSLRRSGIPDKVMDDMAYRRLHPKERPGSQDVRNVVSQSGSYLESSPAAAAADITPEHLPQKPLYGPMNQEPDVTLDDVVFRNIRHANNTLKILDPQPPFGIPIGPIAPAPNSDYLHAVPGDTYRSMFKPRKVPDVVKDDLAYRNLRKDDKDPSFNLPVTDDMGVLLTHAVPTARAKNDNFSMRKRRAVRSLSANIQSLVNRESLSLASRDPDQDFEKAQSLSDLPDALQVAQKILEGKEVIGGGSIKIRNLTSGSSSQHSGDQEAHPCPPESRRYCSSPGTSWVERAHLTDLGDRSSFLASTSTETLTDSRANLLHQESVSNKRASWQHKLRVFIPPPPVTTAENDEADVSGDGSILQRPPPIPTPERNSSKQVTDNHQRPPPPPTPERSSSRRPSLDQSKILASLVHLQSPVSVDRESPRQIQNISRPTPPLSPTEETHSVKAIMNSSDRRSARNSREIKIGKSSPLPDDSLPFPEAVPGSPLDEKQLEDLLSALAREARATSEKLEKELEVLGGDTSVQTVKANQPTSETHNKPKAKEQEAELESNCTKEGEGFLQEKCNISQYKENKKSSLNPKQKCGLETRLQVEEEKIKLQEITDSTQDKMIPQDDTASHGQSTQNTGSGNNEKKGDNHKQTQEEISAQEHAPNDKKSVVVKLPSPESEPTANPVFVVEEECGSEDNVNLSSKSEHSNIDEDKLVSSSSSFGDNFVEKQSLGVHEDLPFIDSSDRKSMSKSPINVQITNIVDSEESSSKCNVVIEAESDGAICNNDCRSEVVCQKSKIPVKVKCIEPNPLSSLQEPMESHDCVPCEVHDCSKHSQDKLCLEPAVSSVPMTKDIAAGGDVSSGSVVKEEGEELGASAPTTSSAAGGSSSGRSGSSGGCGECEGPCGDRQDHETPQHEAMYSDRRTKAFALEEAPTSGSSDGGADTHRPSAERVARYKEERRRQLASQYGTRDESGGAITPQRRYITRSAVKNGESGSGSNSEHQTSSATKVRTTRTSRLRAAVTSAAESGAQSGKDISGIPTRNGKDSGSASPRSALGKDSKEISSVSRSLFGKDLSKDSCLSPRKDNRFSITRSQSGKDLLKDTQSRTGLSLSRSHSGKDLIKDMGLSPRPHSSKDSVHSKSQSGKYLNDEMGLSPRHPSGRDTSGSSSRSPSGKELKDGGSPLRSLMSSSRTRRIGMTERRGLTSSTGSSDKEKSPAAVNTSDGISSSPRREKDKSSKRKSNLNRSLTTEEVVPVDTGEDNSAIRRRRRRGDHGVGSNGVSLSNLDGGPLHKSLLDSSLLSQSSTSPSHSSRSESSPLKASSDLQSPPSRALLRLTADSGTHFLQARRSARKTSPVASPLKSSEREATPPPSKLKAAGTSLSVYSSTVQQETPRSDKVSQRVERLMASARDAVIRLNKLSGESSSISDGLDNRQPLTHHESGLGDCSSALIDTTKQKTVKSDMNRSTEPPVKKTFSPSPDDDDLQIPVNSSDLSPLENCSIEVPPRSRNNSPSKQPSSILKKKSLDEQFPTVVSTSGHQMPVSILKRKTSQDEAGSGGGGCSVPPPPVTFSPSVLEQTETNSKRQGILKKRCSLDESEVLRRRSCSPDMAGWDSGFSTDFRPILKNQRRSSMEELVRRTFSPDPQPQSILKRRTSRDDEVEERTSGSPEPQGILKRKSGTSSNSSSSSTSPHVSIAASVIMNVVGLDPTSDLPVDSSSEQVRPILKKKSSSEDNTAADSSSTEAPRPILKKKASVDVDDLEDKPMRPILKSCRKSSQEDQTSWESASSMESPVRCLILRNRSAGGSDSASGSDCELVRPILKQPSCERSSRERSSSPRHRLSFCDDQDSNKDDRRDSFGSCAGSSIPSDESRNGSPSREGVILRRRLKQSSAVKSNSTSAMDNELCAILSKRRSLEVSADVESDTVQLRRSRSPIVMETSRGQPRPMSVAERIMNMECFLVQEANTKPTGAVPKRPGSLRASRDRERFHTQPITLDELHASSRLESVKAFQKGILDKKSSENSSFDTVSPIVPSVSPIELPANDCNSPPFPSKEKHNITSPVRDVPGDSVSSYSQPSSPKKEPVFTMSNEVGSHGDDGTKGPQATDEDPEGLLRLCKSNSVVAKASLFAQLEEDMKRAAEEASMRKLPKGTSRGVARYKARREQSSQGVNRFSTQPVTMVEVQEAVRTASSESTISDGKQKSDEDDEPSQLSLAERVKLFNQKIQDDAKAPVVAKQPPPTRKRMGSLSRFKTQPVTNEEVETAAQRISPLAASLAKPPDPKLLGGMSAKAAREKMYEHASAVLTKSSSSSRIVSEKERATTERNEDFENDIKPKGILKNLREIESRTCRSQSLSEAVVSSDVDTESESEVKGILKSSGTPATSGAGTPELESFRHLKSVLKKETASGVNDSPAPEDPLVTATTDHLRSILKPESKEWDESPSSSSSESSSETDLPTRPFSAPSRNTLDLISILHGVEENARKERQALVSSPNNKPQRPNSTEEKIMNLRNLRNEKENHQGIKDATHFERRKIDKDSKITTENHNVKSADLYLDHKSLVKQRKMESKLLVEELNRKSFETHHVQVSEKNHSLNSKRLLDSPIMGHKSMVNQKKLESKKLVEELTGSGKLTQTKKLCDEEETSMYERQLRRQIEELQRLSSSPNDTPTPPTSDGETSSSGGREVRRIIRNEAVARRRQAALARQQREANSNRSELQNQQLKKSQSHSSVSSSSDTQPQACSANVDDEGFVRGGLRRSYTQPLTDQELRDADDNDAMSGASIAERLAALQKSGNTDWRKRVSKLNPEDDLTIICSATQINTHHHLTQESRISSENEKVVKVTEETGSNVSILADRLGKLDAATQGWKKRVGPTDAVQFSVAGRMMMEQTLNTSKAICTGDVTLSPIAPGSPPSQLLRQPSTERKRRTPRAERFRSKAALQKEVASTPSSPQKEKPISFKRSISAPGGEDETDLSVERDEAQCGPKVAVPRLDDETFTSFFSSSISTSSKSQSTERLDICLEDLDQIVSHSSKLSVQKRTVRVQRKAASSRNPIKALAARTDLQDEYVEVRTGVAEKELKRMKVEKLAKHSTLAVEALAGLASREDFTAVALKKAATPSNGNMLPYKDLMLLQVKGRRHVQTRLVEPVASSINSGDNYVLVTPTEVYNYVGRYSNVIERSRGAEVASNIQQKKDLGYSNSRQVINISEEKATCTLSQVENFWKLLGSTEKHAAGAGHPDEDELFESAIIATNMVYEVQDDELVPMTDYWGAIPKIEMLDPSKILVFDFGSEMYVWNGKNAPLDRRRVAQSLARELWAQGFDYSECDVCPITAAAVLGSHDDAVVESRGPARPEWSLLAKVTQHMETILFREKFLDWPDFSRVIRTKGGDDDEKQVDASIDVKPCDIQLMLEHNLVEPDLELEGSHVGRGSHYYDEETHRHHEIKTLGVTVWHILEYEHTELPETSVGHFHKGDSYVVRWLYNITVTGRELSGQPSRHSMLGRDRCAYFCWQGSEASLNEQGAAALLTVELDRERGPQVRVVEGMESPAFLSLFKGHMMVHAGKREDDDSEQKDGTWRLYISRGELQEEGVLVEVPCSVRQLRSRASLVLVNTTSGVIFVWHGAKTQPHTRKIALAAAQQLKTGRPVEVGFYEGVDIIINELHEGEENSKFFRGLGGANRHLYVSLLDNPRPFNKSPRLFHLSSLSGTFCSTEMLGPYRNNESVTAFPFLQSDLYSASQPALFLFDNNAGNELWLWQGWWPDYQGEDTDGCDARGSAAVRWQVERRAAMQTALDYWRSQHQDQEPPVAYLVWAGLEPLHFTNLFPIWTDRDDIAELNIRDGRKPGEILKVEEELARLTRSTYPVAQLLQRPLPDGVDPTHLELYLSPQHFQELLGMSKEEFLELPTWKQTKVKKEVGLF